MQTYLLKKLFKKNPFDDRKELTLKEIRIIYKIFIDFQELPEKLLILVWRINC